MRRPTAIGALVTLLVTTTALVSSPPGVAQDGGVNCDGVEPTIDGEKECIPYATGPVTDNAPLEFGVPAGAANTRCIRPDGLDADTPPSQRDLYGPREIPCVWNGVSGPASDGHYRGFYTRTWDCYVERLAEQPTSDMVGYDAHGGDDGLVFRASCYPPPAAPVVEAETPRGLGHWRTGPQGAEQDPDGATWGGTGQLVVLPEMPPPAEPEPSIVELWVEAVNRLLMRGPAVTTAPPVDAAGLVHLPTWLWTEDTADTWPDELHEFAAEGGTRVDAYAAPQQIEWDMGDGAGPTICEGPGVAWGADSDIFNPPEGACRHTYSRSSRTEAGGVFEILAMTTWLVWWEIDGEFDGELELEVGTTATYQVNEVQVLTRQ